jgi:hypothetical protein
MPYPLLSEKPMRGAQTPVASPMAEDGRHNSNDRPCRFLSRATNRPTDWFAKW